jgi:hypothetical protein
MSEARMFPIQSERGARPHPLLIPWSIAELAYSVYSARYGRSQSLEDLARRGGFGPGEMDMFLPDWRERCDILRELIAACDRLSKVADAVWVKMTNAEAAVVQAAFSELEAVVQKAKGASHA